MGTGGGYEYADRYGDRDAVRPDPATMCSGQCEGLGRVPVHKDDPADEEGDWPALWAEAEREKPTDDGYHFVVCPACDGTGKEK